MPISIILEDNPLCAHISPSYCCHALPVDTCLLSNKTLRQWPLSTTPSLSLSRTRKKKAAMASRLNHSKHYSDVEEDAGEQNDRPMSFSLPVNRFFPEKGSLEDQPPHCAKQAPRVSPCGALDSEAPTHRSIDRSDTGDSVKDHRLLPCLPCSQQSRPSCMILDGFDDFAVCPDLPARTSHKHCTHAPVMDCL